MGCGITLNESEKSLRPLGFMCTSLYLGVVASAIVSIFKPGTLTHSLVDITCILDSEPDQKDVDTVETLWAELSEFGDDWTIVKTWFSRCREKHHKWNVKHDIIMLFALVIDSILELWDSD